MKLWQALAALGGALLVGAAVSEREPIKQTIKKGAKRVSRMTVSDQGLANIQKHDIWTLVKKYGKFPPSLFMAILEVESAGTFDPTIYNYYPLKDDGKKDTSRVKVAYATPGAPLTDKWRKPGDGGCQFDPHACGLGQILDLWRLKANPYGYGNYPLPNLNDLFDPEKNIAAVAGKLNPWWDKIVKSGVPDPIKWALLYLAHNQGGEFVRIALANAGDKTSAQSLFAAAGKTGKPMAVAVGVASRVPFWKAQEPS